MATGKMIFILHSMSLNRLPGKLIAGEQYSITVQATDTGGKSSQTIVEVSVVPGPNTRSPVFQQNTYDVNVSEGASINSTVATITVSIFASAGIEPASFC